MANRRFGSGKDGARKLAGRAAVIAVLVLLHAGLFLAFNPTLPFRAARPASEVMLVFPQAPQRPAEAPVITPTLAVPRPPLVAPPELPQSAGPPAAPVPNAGITGIGHALFDCDLANGRNLSPDQRSNCLHWPMARAVPEVGMPKKSHAVQSARWAAELVARKEPLKVPCTGIVRETIGGFAAQRQTTTLMADPLCVLGKLFAASSEK